MVRIVLSVLALAIVCQPLTAHAQGAGEVQMVARLLVTSGVGGAHADPVCDEGTSLEPTSFASYVARLAAERERDALGATLTLDAGGLLAPHGVARFAADNEPSALGDLVRELQYDALAFGEAELGTPRASMIAAARALRRRGIPMLASNLYCDADAQELCDVLVDASDGVPTFDVDGRSVAVLSFMAPEALRRVAPENSAGLRLSPLAAGMQSAVDAARERGADVVVAIVDDGWGAEALARLLPWIQTLEGASKPDVVLSAGGGSELLFARPATFQPAIVAPPPGRAIDVHIRRNSISQTYDVLAQAFDPAPEPAPPVVSYIERIGSRYCEAWGHALPGGTLEEEMDVDGLLELTADIMRGATGAEVAFLNRSVADARWRPAHPGELTASDVYIGLQYDEPLVMATVDARWLDSIKNVDLTQLLTPGFEIVAKKVKIHGRPIEVRGTYQVVTLRYLAEGGDELLPPGPDWQPVPGGSLRSVVLAYLEEPSEGDPRQSLPTPLDDIEWTLSFNADATFGGSTVRNPGAYGDSQFGRSDTASFGVASAFSIDGISSAIGWENDFVLNFRLTDAGDGFDEGADLLSYRTNFRYRGFRHANDSIYVPEPFIESYVESELTEANGRDFHHLLLRPTAGLRFSLTNKLSLRASAGFEVESLDPDADILPGVGAVLQLSRWRLMASGQKMVDLAITADWFFSDPGGIARHTLRGNFDLLFTMTGHLGLALVMNLYGVQEDGGDFSTATDVTAALRVQWLHRRLRP